MIRNCNIKNLEAATVKKNQTDKFDICSWKALNKPDVVQGT